MNSADTLRVQGDWPQPDDADRSAQKSPAVAGLWRQQMNAPDQ